MLVLRVLLLHGASLHKHQVLFCTFSKGIMTTRHASLDLPGTASLHGCDTTLALLASAVGCRCQLRLKMLLILAGRTPRFDAMSFMVPSGTVSNMLHTAPHNVDAAALRQCERKKLWARQADAVNVSDMSHCHHWLRSTSINPP